MMHIKNALNQNPESGRYIMLMIYSFETRSLIFYIPQGYKTFSLNVEHAE